MQGYCLQVFCEGCTFGPMPPQGLCTSISEPDPSSVQWGDQSLRHLPGHQVKWRKFVLQDSWSSGLLQHRLSTWQSQLSFCVQSPDSVRQSKSWEASTKPSSFLKRRLIGHRSAVGKTNHVYPAPFSNCINVDQLNNLSGPLFAHL